MSKSLKEIYVEKGKSILDDLLNSERITIYEKLDGINFGFVYENGGFTFFKKKPNTPIGSVDRTLSSMYEEPISYINELDKKMFQGIEKWIFSFNYFPNINPVTLKYENQPKNNLVLNYIDDGTGQKILDVDLLNLWADKLEVGRVPIIFDGKFSTDQIEQIFKYLNYTKEEIELQLNGISFTEWLYSVINPELDRTTLNSNLKGNIDSLFFRFENVKGDVYYSKIKSPYMEELLKQNKTVETDHNYYLILSDIVDFLLKKDILNIKLKETTFDERYLELVSGLYNKYMKLKEKDYSELYLNLPEYLTKDFNRLNINLIKDKTTLDLIQRSKINKDTFRIFIASFRKKRHSENFIFNETMNLYFNKIVDDINNVCAYSKDEETGLSESFITFKEFERIFINGEDSEEVIGADIDTILRKQPDIVTGYVDVDFNVDNFLSSVFVHTEKRKRRRDDRTVVNLLIDTFAPFSRSLEEFVNFGYSEDGIPYLVICVRNKNSVFSEDILENIFKSLLSKDQYEDYLFVDRPNLRKIVAAIETKYRINKVVANDRFMKLLNIQILDNYRNNNILDFVDSDEEEAEYYTTDNSLFVTVNQSLYNSEFSEFRKLVIDEYANMFNEFLRKFNGY
jgi:hypothetical protein